LEGGVGIDFKVNHGGEQVPIGASFDPYMLRRFGDVGLIENGVYIRGRKYVLEEYDDIASVGDLPDYLETLQTISDNVPMWLRVLAFPYRVLSFLGKSEVQRAYLGDDVSFVELDPDIIPAGVELGVAYWDWDGPDEVAPKVSFDERQAITAKLRSRAEKSFGMTYGIGGFHQFEPLNTALLDSMTLTLTYDESEIVGFDEQDLAVYYEDKGNHRFVYVGGVVNPDSNWVTVEVDTLLMYTLAPKLPFGDIELVAAQDTLAADGVASTVVTTTPMLNNDGSVVVDGALFTVNTTNGSISEADLDVEMPGIQVASLGGVVNFELVSSEIPVPAITRIRSVDGSAAGADTLIFRDLGWPSAPTGVAALAHGPGQVDVSWERNTEPDIAGYRVYFDNDGPEPPYSGSGVFNSLPSPIDVGNDTTLTILGLEPDTNYFLTVTAYDAAGNEGPYCEAVASTQTTNVGNDIPAAFALNQNYPNPFNPMTKIGFSIPRAGRVSLKIYDIRGRLVKTLVDGQVPAGRHEETWLGDDSRGRPVASGVYLYRLHTEQETKTRKMAVVR
jgi:hypothetical protein